MKYTQETTLKARIQRSEVRDQHVSHFHSTTCARLTFPFVFFVYFVVNILLMSCPIIGITCDTAAGHTPDNWTYESPHAYCRVVVQAGGVPFLLPYELERIPDYLRMCHGLILSGGDDPDTTPFGQPVHPKAKLMHPQRQAFESALLAALDATPHPVLGVCLGMQMMALHAGGSLHQHLPDAPGFDEQRAAAHYKRPHDLRLLAAPGIDSYLTPGVVHSRHHQAVADPGALRPIADFDGVIEAIASPADPGRRFYLGVQWHPECTVDDPLGPGLIRRFVQACGEPIR